jgi:hypothetical protein
MTWLFMNSKTSVHFLSKNLDATALPIVAVAFLCVIFKNRNRDRRDASSCMPQAAVSDSLIISSCEIKALQNIRILFRLISHMCLRTEQWFAD